MTQPIRTKFVYVADELVEQLRAAPPQPIRLQIEEGEGGELHFVATTVRPDIDRVVKAIRTINRYHDLASAVYDVRNLEANVRSLRADQSSWEGPVVKEYSDAVKLLLDEGVFAEPDPKPEAVSQPNGNGNENGAASAPSEGT